jgi:hypothetical protein
MRHETITIITFARWRLGLIFYNFLRLIVHLALLVNSIIEQKLFPTET